MRRRICWYLSILLSFTVARHIYHLTRTYLPHILFVLVHIYYRPRLPERNLSQSVVVNYHHRCSDQVPMLQYLEVVVFFSSSL
jgi:hypothetical protein